jgi:hypothetical protein
VFLGVALGLASGSALAATYRLTDLGTLGGTQSFGFAINASGQVTGESFTTATGGDSRTGEAHAYLVSPIPVTVPDPRAQIEALVEVVHSLTLKAGMGNAPDTKLQNALGPLDRGHQQDNGSAVGSCMRSFRALRRSEGRR